MVKLAQSVRIVVPLLVFKVVRLLLMAGIDSVVTLKPANGDAPFLFEGKGYRGGLTLRANNGTMMVINSVPLEDYLYGVVPQEVVPSWPAAALEAQAVAARTYALHTMEQNKGKIL